MVVNPYRVFFVQSTIGMGRINPTGGIVEVNPALCALLGYRAVELQGMPLHQLMHPSDREAYQAGLARLQAGTVTLLTLEQRLLHRCGQSRWVRACFSRVPSDSPGMPQWLAIVIEEMHQRKCLEVNLRCMAAHERTLTCAHSQNWQHDDTCCRQHLSEQLAIARLQGDCYSQLQQELHHHRAIHELSRVMLGVQDLESFFRQALAKIQDMLLADQVVIGQYHPANHCWLLIAEAPASPVQSVLGKEFQVPVAAIWPDPTAATPVVIEAVSLGASVAAELTKMFPGAWVLSPLCIQSGVWGGLMIGRQTWN